MPATATVDPEALHLADVAYARVEAFARRFGEAHLLLAMHAAAPVALTPELVHLLRINFVRAAPFIAEADLLLSLADDAGGGLYHLRPDVRELLRTELERDPDFGPARVRSIAEFLLAWSTRAAPQAKGAAARALVRALQWQALAHLRPADAARELAGALHSGLAAGDRREALRVARLTDSMAIELTGEQEMLRYAEGLMRLARGDGAGARRMFGRAGDTARPIVIGGVALPAPDRLAEWITRPAAETAPPAAAGYQTARAVLLGDPRSGRTALAHVLVGRTFDEAHDRRAWPIGALAAPEDVASAVGRDVVIWDVPDHPVWPALLELRAEDVAVICLPTADFARDAAEAWIARVRERHAQAAIVVVATASDTVRAHAGPLTTEHYDLLEVQRAFDELVRSQRVQAAVMVSALDGYGIELLRRELLAAVRWEAQPEAPDRQSQAELERMVAAAARDGRQLVAWQELFAMLRAGAGWTAASARAAAECAHRRGALRLLHGGRAMLVDASYFEDAALNALAGRAADDPYRLGSVWIGEAASGKVRSSRDPERTLAFGADVLEPVLAELVAAGAAYRLALEDDALALFPALLAAADHVTPPAGLRTADAFDAPARGRPLYQALLATLVHGHGYALEEIGRRAARFAGRTPASTSYARPGEGDAALWLEVAPETDGRSVVSIMHTESADPALISEFVTAVQTFLARDAEAGEKERAAVGSPVSAALARVAEACVRVSNLGEQADWITGLAVAPGAIVTAASHFGDIPILQFRIGHLSFQAERARLSVARPAPEAADDRVRAIAGIAVLHPIDFGAFTETPELASEAVEAHLLQGAEVRVLGFAGEELREVGGRVSNVAPEPWLLEVEVDAPLPVGFRGGPILALGQVFGIVLEVDATDATRTILRAAGASAVRAAFEQPGTAVEEVRAAKVVVIGPEGSGRTALVRALAGMPFDERADTRRALWDVSAPEYAPQLHALVAFHEASDAPDWPIGLSLDSAAAVIVTEDAGSADLERVRRTVLRIRAAARGELTVLLAGTRADRYAHPDVNAAQRELFALADELGLAGWLMTSAHDALTITAMREQIVNAIPWDSTVRAPASDAAGIREQVERLIGEQADPLLEQELLATYGTQLRAYDDVRFMLAGALVLPAGVVLLDPRTIEHHVGILRDHILKGRAGLPAVPREELEQRRPLPPLVRFQGTTDPPTGITIELERPLLDVLARTGWVEYVETGAGTVVVLPWAFSAVEEAAPPPAQFDPALGATWSGRIGSSYLHCLVRLAYATGVELVRPSASGTFLRVHDVPLWLSSGPPSSEALERWPTFPAAPPDRAQMRVWLGREAPARPRAEALDVVREAIAASVPSGATVDFQVFGAGEPASPESPRAPFDALLAHAPPPPSLPPGKQWHVYLTYRSAERAWIGSLNEILHEQGFQVFFDREILPAGDDWERTLEESVSRSVAGVLPFSSRWVDAEWLRRELQVMERAERSGDFRIVPVRLDRSEVPPFAQDHQLLDFSEYPDAPDGAPLLHLLHALAGRPLTPEAARFARDLDDELRRTYERIDTAVRDRDPDRLVQLFQAGAGAWQRNSTLGVRVARGLVALAAYDAAMQVASTLRARFPAAPGPLRVEARARLQRRAQGDLDQAHAILGDLFEAGERDEETIGLYARTWRERHRASGDARDLRRARDLYAEAFAIAPQDHYAGINAAATSVLLGEPADVEAGRALAERVLRVTGSEPAPGDYWTTATVAEALLIGSAHARAADVYAAALAMAPDERFAHESTWQQACRLMAKLALPAEDRARIRAVFTHLPDCPPETSSG